MRILNEGNRNLAEKHLYISEIAYYKLLNRYELVEYKDELISEGNYAICVASTYFDKAKCENSFFYFFKAAINSMIDFVQTFIYPQSSIISLDSDDEEDIRYLANCLSTMPTMVSTEALISDLINEYKLNVINSKNLTKAGKTHRLKPSYLDNLKHILKLMSEGLKESEIAIEMGKTRQWVNNKIINLRDTIS